MVADMETDRDARAMLAEVERAAAAPYVDYPPTPAWYPPAVGAWAAAMALAIAGTSDRPVVAVPVLLVLIALEGMFFGWYRRTRQTTPSLRNVPVEVDHVMRRYVVGVVIVVALGLAAAWFGGRYVAAAVLFVTVTVGLTVYERAYASAAAATRRRLR